MCIVDGRPCPVDRRSPTMLAAIQSETLRRRVFRHLFEAILRGELAPGDRIVEGNLAKQLGVSKTTLREALHDLEHQGLLTKHDHRATFVTKLNRRQIEDAYDVRAQLEPYAAALAHERMTRKRFAQLSDLLQKIRRNGEQGYFLEVSKADAELHHLIWQQSGNETLARTLRLICMPLFAFELIRLHAAPTYDFERMVEEHVILLETLKKGGPEEVRTEFARMIQVFRNQDIDNLEALEANQREPGERD